MNTPVGTAVDRAHELYARSGLSPEQLGLRMMFPGPDRRSGAEL